MVHSRCFSKDWFPFTLLIRFRTLVVRLELFFAKFFIFLILLLFLFFLFSLFLFAATTITYTRSRIKRLTTLRWRIPFLFLFRLFLRLLFWFLFVFFICTNHRLQRFAQRFDRAGSLDDVSHHVCKRYATSWFFWFGACALKTFFQSLGIEVRRY